MSAMGTNCTGVDGPRTILTVCSTCKGKGFIVGEMDERSGYKSLSESAMPLAMPKIRSSQKLGYRQSQRMNKQMTFGLSSNTTESALSSAINRSRPMERLPPIRRRDSSVASSVDSTTGEMIPQIQIIDLAEFIRKAKMRLKSGNIEEISLGVVDVVHIHRVDENAAFSFMPLVNRLLVDLLRSLRVTILRRACQSISNLYRKMSYVTRPEFDEMLILLLKRTGDSKKRVQDDAKEALDVLVETSPPPFVIRALCVQGPESKNPSLRMTTARIISRCINQVGCDNLLRLPNLREMRKRVIEVGCHLILDPNAEVKGLAKNFMNQLRTTEGFDEALETDIPRHLLTQVDKALVWMKFGDRTSSIVRQTLSTE